MTMPPPHLKTRPARNYRGLLVILHLRGGRLARGIPQGWPPDVYITTACTGRTAMFASLLGAFSPAFKSEAKMAVRPAQAVVL